MAEFDSRGHPVGASQELAHIIWSSTAHRETLHRLFFEERGMSAEDTKDGDSFKRMGGPPVVRKTEFGRQRGAKLRTRFLKQLTRKPQDTTAIDGVAAGTLTYGTTNMLGREEKAKYLYVEIVLQMLKNAMGIDTPSLHEIRTDINWMDDYGGLLKDWLTEQQEELYLDGFYDGKPYIVTADTAGTDGGAVVAHPNQQFGNGLADLAAIRATHVPTMEIVRRMSAWLTVNKINPCKVDGKNCFLALASPRFLNDLRNDDTFQVDVGRAHPRGKDDHPLIGMADFGIHKIYFHEYERTYGRNTTNATIAGDLIERMPVLGSKALSVGYGSRPVLVRRAEHAYRDRDGIAIKQILGARRMEYSAQTGDTAETINQSSVVWHFYQAAEF